MAVVIRSHRIAYFPIPKCANTSIKAALREACASAELVDTGNQPMSDRLRRRTKGYFRIAVIREPRGRALSAYGNRVVHRRDIARAPIGRYLLPLFGLDPVPGPDEFFVNLRTYAALSKQLRRHVRPQAAYLGDDLSFFDAIYKLDELDRFAEDLSARIAASVKFDRLQTAARRYRLPNFPSRHSIRWTDTSHPTSNCYGTTTIRRGSPRAVRRCCILNKATARGRLQ